MTMHSREKRGIFGNSMNMVSFGMTPVVVKALAIDAIAPFLHAIPNSILGWYFTSASKPMRHRCLAAKFAQQTATTQGISVQQITRGYDGCRSTLTPAFPSVGGQLPAQIRFYFESPVLFANKILKSVVRWRGFDNDSIRLNHGSDMFWV